MTIEEKQIQAITAEQLVRKYKQYRKLMK